MIVETSQHGAFEQFQQLLFAVWHFRDGENGVVGEGEVFVEQLFQINRRHVRVSDAPEMELRLSWDS